MKFQQYNQERLSPATADWFGNTMAAIDVTEGPGWPDEFGSRTRQLIASSQVPKVRTLSLFSGAGGLDIAFHDAGFEVVEMVEIEDKFVATLRTNSKESGYLRGSRPTCIDIAKFDTSSLQKIEFIIGGPPCQSWSAAGRRANGVRGIHDARGQLFEEYVRILAELQPKGFLFENVYGITGANGGSSWPQIVAAFADVGYRVEYRVLDAADFGVPQHRERMFIVGFAEQAFRFPRPTHGPDSPSRRPHFPAALAIEDVHAPEERRQGIGGRFGHLLVAIPPGLNYSFYTAELGHPNPVFAWRSKFSDFLYKADPSQPVRTIKAQGGQYTGPFHWDSRGFSVAELKRLQTFPDAYEVVGGRQVSIQQLGNSVPPQIGRVLALAIRDQFFGIPKTLSGLPTLDHGEQLGFRQRKRHRTDQYREAARRALDSTAASRTSRAPVKAFNRRYSLRDDLLIHPNREGAWKIVFRPGRHEWKMSVRLLEPSRESVKAQLEIERIANHATWNLPISRVSFDLDLEDARCLLVAWRAFESVLIDADFKTDLVQLAGYYQYAPSFASKMHITGPSEDSSLWRAIERVSSGVGVRSIVAKEQLANELGVQPSEVLAVLRSLKKAGYEIRNTETNPEIPSDSYLIPYSFPTLTGASVQFSKHL